MRQRSRTVVCPNCHKKFSPQGLNGHMRFVHGVGAEEAAKAIATAPRTDEADSSTAKLADRVESLEGTIEEIMDVLVPIAQEYHSRSGNRRRLVSLLAELTDVKKQRASKDWDTWFTSGEERRRVLGSYDHIEADINAEIAELSAKLSEPES